MVSSFFSINSSVWSLEFLRCSQIGKYQDQSCTHEGDGQMREIIRRQKTILTKNVAQSKTVTWRCASTFPLIERKKITAAHQQKPPQCPRQLQMKNQPRWWFFQIVSQICSSFANNRSLSSMGRESTLIQWNTFWVIFALMHISIMKF